MNMTDEALFDAIAKLRGRFTVGVFAPTTMRLSFTKIADRLRSQGFRRSDGSLIEDDAVIALYRAKVPKD